MTIFNHYLAIKVNRNGRGLLGDSVQIEEYDHLYFEDAESVSNAYKLIDKLIKAAKREDITISLYESGKDVETVRRLFIQFDYGFRAYGVAEVGRCDDHGCFDYRQPMDADSVRKEIRILIDIIADEQRRSVAA